jgi:hypothetical protein
MGERRTGEAMAAMGEEDGRDGGGARRLGERGDRVEDFVSRWAQPSQSNGDTWPTRWSKKRGKLPSRGARRALRGCAVRAPWECSNHTFRCFIVYPEKKSVEALTLPIR